MEILRLWWVQALVISAGAALFLNGAPFLPYLNRIKARKMDARLVGFAGTTAAFYLWCKLNPELLARDAFPVWLLICTLTVGINWIIHLIRRDNPPADDDDHRVQGRLPNIIILPLESCEEILDSLTQPRRDLTVALEAISLAVSQAKKVAALAPDQLGAQVWCQKVGDPLNAAERLVEESREQLEDTHQRVVAFWQITDELRELYRRGKLIFST